MKVLHSVVSWEGHNVRCEQMWTLSCRACQTHRRKPHHAHYHVVCTACVPTVIPDDANTRYQPNIDCSAPARACFQLRFEFSCQFHIYFIWWPVSGLYVFIMSFDLATRPWSRYLISPVWCSNIDLLPDPGVHDNTVLICAGRHWLAVYACFFNFRHLNIPGVYYYYYYFFFFLKHHLNLQLLESFYILYIYM